MARQLLVPYVRDMATDHQERTNISALIRHAIALVLIMSMERSMTMSDLQRLADEDLMPLVEQRDPAAFEIVFDRHGGAAYSLAYRIVGERAKAEEPRDPARCPVKAGNGPAQQVASRPARRER